MIFLTCVKQGAFAQAVSNAAGVSIPLDTSIASARSAALASSLAAVPDDGTALLGNPAGLGTLPKGELSLHYQAWIANTDLNTLLFALPLGSLGGFGLVLNYMDYGSFEGRDANGTPTADFSANRMSFQGGWGKRWNGWFSSGLEVHYSQQSLSGQGYGAFLLDGGLLLKPSPEWSFGLAFNDLGTELSQGNSPLVFRLGASFHKTLSKDLSFLAAGGGSWEPEGTNSLQGGLETVFAGQYALRAGYQWNSVDNQWEGLSGLTLGAGYSLGDFSLDYAFLPYGDLGTSNRISLSYRFPIASGPQVSLEPVIVSEAEGPVGKPVDPNLNGNGKETGDHPSLDLLSQGQAMEKQGKYREAGVFYFQCVQNDPKNPQAWFDLGTAYMRLGQRNDAIQCFERVLTLKPGFLALQQWLERYKAGAPNANP